MNVLLPRDAMHKRGLRCHAVSVCLSVRPSRSWITSERKNIFSKFFHHQIATPFQFFHTKGGADILKRPPLLTRPVRGVRVGINGGIECKGYDKMSIFFTDISLYLTNGYRQMGICSEQLVSIEFSFHPYIIQRDCSRGVPRGTKMCATVRENGDFLTFVDHVKTNKHMFDFFSPSGSHTILVYRSYTDTKHRAASLQQQSFLSSYA